ncbi:MAG: class I SAM-dependent methyltransferase, partial [Fimbriimonadaceae bacterium]
MPTPNPLPNPSAVPLGGPPDRPWHPLLIEILTTRQVRTETGEVLPLDSEVDPNEGQLIDDVVTERGFRHGLEVGCAYGVSALFACQALGRRPEPSHTIVDPFQHANYRGIGLANLARAGFDFVEFHEKPSEIALPELLASGRRFDFAVIDGNHTFDHTLVDFFFANRMIGVGGVVFIDDVDMPGIRRLIRYILRYPGYRVAGVANRSDRGPTLRRRVADAFLRVLTAPLPASYRQAVFADDW